MKLFFLFSYYCKNGKGMFFYGSMCLAISRMFQMIAFFLPIKILIMLSSETKPEYLSLLTDYIPYQEVVLSLALAVPLVYFLHLLFGVAYRRCIDRDLKGHDNDENNIRWVGKLSYNKIKKLHNHSSKAFSDCLLVIVSLTVLTYIDYSLTIAVMILIFVDAVMFTEFAYYKKDTERLTVFKLHKRQFIEYISSINYLFIFALLVLIMTVYESNVYSVILALLLSRQAFQALQRFSIENLYIAKHI
ncbi:hypothetical protein Q4589_01240 [Cobetia marina]|uniref:hypothetical protein n=1 Tax=Cobetia marina TaxID=28258 RepID=UPI0026E21101|nr:hypothetical protein [Cobetia marina]MDO6786208.1 hypothetical protein [Cobetia marina]